MFELETAAAEIENTAFGGLSSNTVCERVETPPACLLHLEQACFHENSQMLGDVVVRGADAPGNLADVERGVQQERNNPNSRVLSERLQRDDAPWIERRDLCDRPTMQLNGLWETAGTCHVLLPKSHNHATEASGTSVLRNSSPQSGGIPLAVALREGVHPRVLMAEVLVRRRPVKLAEHLRRTEPRAEQHLLVAFDEHERREAVTFEQRDDPIEIARAELIPAQRPVAAVHPKAAAVHP